MYTFQSPTVDLPLANPFLRSRPRSADESFTMSGPARQRRGHREPNMDLPPAFSVGATPIPLLGRRPLPATSPRRPPRATRMSSQSPKNDEPTDEPRRIRPLQWARVAVAAAGIAAGGVFNFGRTQHPSPTSPPSIPSAHASETTIKSNQSIPLRSLGIKQSDYLGERELRLRKTTQYSEAEEEIMELEEYAVATKWFRDLQAMWAGVASVGGIAVLYKGGVLWERWIQEQERKDMEEEIELTGKFISPRAVRKDGDEGEDGGKGKGKDGKGSGDGPPVVGDSPPGGIEGLEKLLGNK